MSKEESDAYSLADIRNITESGRKTTANLALADLGHVVAKEVDALLQGIQVAL